MLLCRLVETNAHAAAELANHRFNFLLFEQLQIYSPKEIENRIVSTVELRHFDN